MEEFSIDAKRAYREFLGLLEAQHISGLADYAPAMAEYYEMGAAISGGTLPWDKTHDKFRFRPGELTLWAGYSGHGKSGLVGQAMGHLVKHCHHRVGVASFEMLPQALVDRHLRQEIGRTPSSYDNYREVHDILSETKGKYYIYDERHLINPEKVLGSTAHMMGKLECNHVVIDSLVKCGISRKPDHAANIERFMNDLQSMAKHYSSHVHLVCHLRKGDGEGTPPTKHDVKYAGELTDLAENVLIVWRNKPKEENGTVGPDAILRIEKQRYLSWEGAIKLAFDKDYQRWDSDDLEY